MGTNLHYTKWKLFFNLSDFFAEPPSVTRTPNNSVVEEGGEVGLECEVGGSPTPTIVWLLNGELLNNDSHARIRGGSISHK